MARLFNTDFSPSGSTLAIDAGKDDNPNGVDVYYIPSEDTLKEAGIQPSKKQIRVRVLSYFPDGPNWLTISPINTLPTHSDFLKPKYSKIRDIMLEGFGFEAPSTPEDVQASLEDLPSGFIKDFEFGLGLLKDYRFIIDAAEEISDSTCLMISKIHETQLDPIGSIVLSWQDFDWLRRKLNQTTNRGRIAAKALKQVHAYNLFASRLELNQRDGRKAQDLIAKLIHQSEDDETAQIPSPEEIAVANVRRASRAIAAHDPEKLSKLKSDLELVSLEQLIVKFEEMLPKKLPESRWQELLNENAFVLTLAFGYPIIKVQDQASVGGRKLSGSGDKITDFVAKNSLTDNIAIIEIKKPSTLLLNQTPYREGTYAPSKELSGAITQTLDQRQKLQTEIANIRYNSRINDVEAHAIHCALIIGTMPPDADRKRSLELFRRNSKDVEIITFDELLAKLKQLHQFLQHDEASSG